MAYVWEVKADDLRRAGTDDIEALMHRCTRELNARNPLVLRCAVRNEDTLLVKDATANGKRSLEFVITTGGRLGTSEAFDIGTVAEARKLVDRLNIFIEAKQNDEEQA